MKAYESSRLLAFTFISISNIHTPFDKAMSAVIVSIDTTVREGLITIVSYSDRLHTLSITAVQDLRLLFHHINRRP